MLSRELHLSRPTMSAAMLELTRHDLVATSGESRGHTGRTAAVYSLAASAGHVIAIELGASRVRTEAYALDGSQLAAVEEHLSSTRRTVTPTLVRKATVQLREVRSTVGTRHGALHDVVIVAPTLPSPLHAFDRRPDGVRDLAGAFDLPDTAPSLIENNVNCAAVAEHRHGAARGVATFLYLQVGVKIGAGLVINGKLHRGAHGAAGEVASLPYPWAPGEPSRRLGLEHHLGSEELIRRAQARWPAAGAPAPRTATELFARAAADHPTALDMVEEHAADIGRLVAAVMTMVDPEVVLLGGGVGQNELLLPVVRRTVRSLAWDTDIRIGTLGTRASIIGAVHLATTRAVGRMF